MIEGDKGGKLLHSCSILCLQCYCHNRTRVPVPGVGKRWIKFVMAIVWFGDEPHMMVITMMK